MSGSDHPQIPVIDLRSQKAAEDVFNAACDYGFIFVKHEGLGLSPTDVAEMFHISQDFFSAPRDVKAECTINSAKSGTNHGWLSMHAESLDPQRSKKGDLKEAFNMGEYRDGRSQQPLPQPLKPHEQSIGQFMAKCHELCDRVLEALAAGLGIPEEHGGTKWFSERHDKSKRPSGSILRFLYYPQLPEALTRDPREDIRAGAHSDYGSVTLLFRLPGQPGLEILTKSGDWAAVPTNPDDSAGPDDALPILINIGDLLSYWTNGLLKSTVHRVVFPDASGPGTESDDRYSLAYFCHPLDDAQLVHVPSSVIRKHKPKPEDVQKGTSNVKTARDHLNARLAATYKIT
ncbi:MAG: hypothetical protein M1828_005505 [Chrysothrix sp. TS-e1954]|nr:MAG: hypothetical protein M1828_005505 [Chrysothrix sp. TS-e1954]